MGCLEKGAQVLKIKLSRKNRETLAPTPETRKKNRVPTLEAGIPLELVRSFSTPPFVCLPPAALPTQERLTQLGNVASSLLFFTNLLSTCCCQVSGNASSAD